MEFIYYPLAVRKEKERQNIPGAVVLAAPHTAHRHRRDDLLAGLLHVNGDHRYEAEEIQALVENAAGAFFSTQGSVTRAMQQACEDINRKIMERNLDRGYEGIRAGGSLCLAVLHNDWLFVCQFGRIGTLHISTDKFEEYGKSEGTGENLGQSKRILPRFFQGEIKAGDLVLINNRIPPTWSSYYLAGSSVLDMEQVKRRLLNQITSDIEAIVIKTRQGGTQVEMGNWYAEAEDHVPPEELADTASPDLVKDSEITHKETTLDEPSLSSDTAEAVSREGRLEKEIETPEEIYPDDLETDAIPVVPGQTEQDDLSQSAERIVSGDGESPSPFMLKMAHAWMNIRTLNSKMRLSLDRLRKKIAPKSKSLQEPSTPALMVILSLLLPVALILLSVSVYTRIGKAEQYDAYMQQAQEAVDLALVEEDAIQLHAYWAQAFDYVKSAEDYQVTQDSRKLYEQAQSMLDDMDLAARLDFKPALTQFFPEGTQISRIQTSSSGVYLLDRTSGSIVRIFLNTKGFYEVDEEFSCVPGPYGLETVSGLIDFVTLPANQDNYRIMAVDGNGNLLYCRPGEVPVSRTLAAPANGWGRIAGVRYADDILYVLDAEKDAIWMYAGKDPNQPDSQNATGIVFSESPVSFFDEDVPDLGGAVDLIVNQEDAYILHQDGHMTLCRYSSEKDVRLTECQDPSPYTDDRVGREDKKPWIFSDANFTMLDGTKLTSASIYVLDALDPSIYQFSYQLNLERVLRPQYNRNYPLPESSPTGIGITSDMDIFIAFDNKLYIAPLN